MRHTNEMWSRFWKLQDADGYVWSQQRSDLDWKWFLSRTGITVFLNMETGREVRLNLTDDQNHQVKYTMDWKTLSFLSPLFV